MKEIQEIYNEFKGSLDLIESIFGKYRKDGKNYKVQCPHCNGNDCQVSSTEAVYYCFNCGAKGNYVTALKVKHDIGFKEATRMLCELTGKPSDFLDHINESTYDKVKVEAEKKKKNDQLELSFLLTNALEKSEQALNYLTGRRKFSLLEIKAAKLGLVTKGNFKKINEILAANDKEILSDRYVNRIAIPTDNNFFDTFTSYIFRSFDPSENFKYLQSPGSDKNNLFSLVKGKDENFKHLVIVEGILEALIQNVRNANARGNYWWLGIGGVNLEQKWEQIDFVFSKEKLESCTILLDNDKTGISTTLSLTPEVVKNMSASLKHTLYFWDWKKVGIPSKDTLDLLAETEYTYEDLIGDIEEKQYEKSLWEQIITICFFDSELNGRDFVEINHVHLKEGTKKFKEFVKVLAFEDLVKLKLALENRFKKQETVLKDLLAEFDQLITEKREEEYLKECKEYFLKGINIKDLAQLEQFKKEIPIPNAQTINSVTGKKIVDYFSSEISDTYPTFYLQLDALAGFSVGGLHLIAASTGGGKTAFLLNLLRLQLQNSTEKCLYLSIEEDEFQLLKKLTFSIGNTLITDVNYASQNLTKFSYYVKEVRNTKPNLKLEEAINFVEKRRETEQLKVIYKDGMFLEDFEELVSFYAKKGFRFFFIDYIQKLKSKNSRLEGYLLGKQIGEVLTAVARKYQVFLVSGCQFNRAPGARFDKLATIDDIRESADFANNASLVIGLSNLPVESQEDEQAKSTLFLTILKNRYGMSGEKLEYFFCKPTCHISERYVRLEYLT